MNMKGIEFMLKVIELRDPRAKNFDPANAVDSSFIQGIGKDRLRRLSLDEDRHCALTIPDMRPITERPDPAFERIRNCICR